MDGRKRNKGTKGNKGGRPPKADEIKVAEKFRAILEDETVIEQLAEKVKQGEMKAIELWLAYTNGRPPQSIDHSHKIKDIKPPKWNVIDGE